MTTGASASLPLSEDEEELRATVERFAKKEVAPVIGGFYEREEFPYEIVAKMGKMGLFGLPLPERYGGMGGDYVDFCLALEELARVDSSVAITLEAAVGLGAMPIYHFGTEEQKQRWLPSLCRGEQLGAFALTEPGGGSDAGAARTRARRDGAEWVIDGTKVFITNAGTDITGLVTVAAVTGAAVTGAAVTGDAVTGDAVTGAGAAGPAVTAGATASRRRPEISAIVVPAGTPGLSVSKKYSKVGWSASDTREVSFSGCRVPLDNLLGVEGRGYAQFLQILDEGRVAVAALSVGLAQGCIDECLPYMAEREAFGRKLAEYEALQFKLADMEARAHAARLAWYDAARRLVEGKPFKKQAAMAKLLASDAAMVNAREATQIFGGYGFMNETPVGRFYRDAKILEVGEGTSEVLRLVIARELGLPAGPGTRA
ncbi:MAG: acyl-CoA dehydrogenase family protein [Actinomycetota bacterium]|jgi:alkylation response protein AidB-like acyl-CoA dehydrogenase|nr:acyl-CoA dehydrogenase family protein [Actinomycetota bacterium]